MKKQCDRCSRFVDTIDTLPFPRVCNLSNNKQFFYVDVCQDCSYEFYEKMEVVVDRFMQEIKMERSYNLLRYIREQNEKSLPVL